MTRLRRSMTLILRGFGVVLALACAATSVSAQEEPRLSLVAGISQYDLSGTGDAFTTAVRFDAEITEVLLWEASIGLTFPPQQFGDTTTLLIPEAQVQLQWPGRLSPYLGAGAGISMDFREEEFGGTQTEPTFAAALGARFGLTEQVGLRAELRVRGIGGGFEGSAAEWTAGVSYRF